MALVLFGWSAFVSSTHIPKAWLMATDERLTILAKQGVSRGKYAAAAVHAALEHYGIEHGAVIVLGAKVSDIEAGCDVVIRDAGRTEVEPGTVTAGVRR